jgi:TPR repeat protein
MLLKTESGKAGEPGTEGRAWFAGTTVRFWTIFCVALSAAAVIGFREARKLPAAQAIESALKAQNGLIDANLVAKSIADALENSNPDYLKKTAQKLAAENTPEALIQLYQDLQKLESDKKVKMFSVFVIEQGAVLYQTPTLIAMAGTDYYSGVSVPKDYTKAEKYLSDPALLNNASAQYLLALTYLAADNPAFDEARGTEMLTKLADQGVAAAQNELNNLSVTKSP